MSAWVGLLFIALVPMIIPLTILLGIRRPQGSLAVTSSAAILALAAFWFPLGGISGLKSGFRANYPLDYFVFVGALLLFVASWAIGLTAAVQSRRWLWVALLVVAGYLSVFAVILSVASPDPCLFPPSYPDYYYNCQAANPLGSLLVAAAYFLAPTASLASALTLESGRGLIPRRLGPPDGLRISPLATTLESDTDPKMRVERP